MRGDAGSLLTFTMADERLAAGVERIERALARIAAAAGVPSTAARDTTEIDAIRARHEGLKREVAQVLGELDSLARG